jgi:hypothetical protein
MVGTPPSALRRSMKPVVLRLLSTAAVHDFSSPNEPIDLIGLFLDNSN